MSTSGQRTWESIASCGTAPYTYEWRYSYDGFNYSSVSGTAETYSSYFYPGSNPNFYLSRLIRSADGQQSTSFLHVYVSIPAGSRIASAETDYSLSNAFPNPFNQSTQIKFSLPEPQTIKLAIFDYMGRSVQLLANGLYPAGEHVKEFKGNAHPQGLYFYRLDAGNFRQTKRLVLAR